MALVKSSIISTEQLKRESGSLKLCWVIICLVFSNLLVDLAANEMEWGRKIHFPDPNLWRIRLSLLL